jgi:ribosomal protein S27E
MAKTKEWFIPSRIGNKRKIEYRCSSCGHDKIYFPTTSGFPFIEVKCQQCDGAFIDQFRLV